MLKSAINLGPYRNTKNILLTVYLGNINSLVGTTSVCLNIATCIFHCLIINEWKLSKLMVLTCQMHSNKTKMLFSYEYPKYLTLALRNIFICIPINSSVHNFLHYQLAKKEIYFHSFELRSFVLIFCFKFGKHYLFHHTIVSSEVL